VTPVLIVTGHPRRNLRDARPNWRGSIELESEYQVSSKRSASDGPSAPASGFTLAGATHRRRGYRLCVQPGSVDPNIHSHRRTAGRCPRDLRSNALDPQDHAGARVRGMRRPLLESARRATSS